MGELSGIADNGTVLSARIWGRFWPTGERLAVEIGHLQGCPACQRMVRCQGDDLPFDQQVLAVQTAKIVVRSVQQRRVSAPVSEHGEAIIDAVHDLDWYRVRFGPVAGEDVGKQAGVGPGFHRKHQSGRGSGCALCAPGRSDDGAECVDSLAQKDLPRSCQADVTAGAGEQAYVQAMLEPSDCPRQCRLCDPETFCGAAKVQLLSDRHEVGQLARLQQIYA